jgi:hypothetical protein
VCMEKKEKKNRKVKKNIYLCVYEKMKESDWKRKRKKREERSGKKDMRGMNQVKRKNKEQGRMSRCWETKLSFFFQPCAIRQRGHRRCLVVIFFLPLHMSAILYLLILDIPTYGLFSWSLALKGKQLLEEVLSLTILVLIVLAIPIAPLYMLYERLMGGESSIKIV